jgi:LPXTG-site transpeptidase (sortase) family protein
VRNVRLSRVNTALLVAIILVNGYTVTLPLLPGIIFWLQTRNTDTVQKLERSIQAAPRSGDATQPGSSQNRLTIPSMLLDEPVFDGKTASTLSKGLWRRPHSSTPDKESNTVIVGHRLTYTNPRGSLYHLDKVRIGDSIGVMWSSEKYLYTVVETKVVRADETAVESPTDKPRLTIYTCTPLWLPKDRLVIVAELEKTL